MLDTYYPSLTAFVAACRAIRAYIRTEEGAWVGDHPRIYRPRAILRRRTMVIMPSGEVVHPVFHAGC